MVAIQKPLNIIQETMMHTLGWMEATYPGKCYFIDVDWDTGTLILAGPDAQDFRDKFNEIIKGVYNAQKG